MLRALRGSLLLPVVAVLALASSAWSALPSMHDEGDDVLCRPVLVVHDHAAHRMGPGDSARPELHHCFICHWLHSLRDTAVAAGFVRPALQPSLFASHGIPSLRSQITASCSDRAPPLA